MFVKWRRTATEPVQEEGGEGERERGSRERKEREGRKQKLYC